MTVAFNARSSQRATTSTRLARFARRRVTSVRVTRALVVALGVYTMAACGDDDNPIVSNGTTTTNGAGGSTIAGGGTGNGGSAGTTGGTAGAGGAVNGSGSTSVNGAGATGAATGTGLDPATGTNETGVSAETAGGAAGAAGSGGATAAAGGAAGATGGVNASDAGVDAGGAAAAAAADLEDGQILFVADTINGGEVDQARAVLPSLDDDDARTFAQQMIDEHEPARDRLLTLAETEDLSPQGSAVATQLRDQSEATIAQLLTLSGDELERAYLDAQVTMHQQALQLMDAMIAGVDSAPLTAELTQQRASVAAHLQTAQQLRDAASD
jgi:putative membrane protein